MQMDDKMLPCKNQTRTQRIGVYLNDLRNRLKVLRSQQNDVLQHSVAFIQELNDVAASISLNQDIGNNGSLTNIKRLILEFESSHAAAALDAATTLNPRSNQLMANKNSKLDIRNLMQNFEKLNESQVLRDSLLYFKQAKESFEQIDNVLDQINEPSSQADRASLHSGQLTTCVTTGSLREKINMFNRAAEAVDAPNYLSCYSSATSLDNYHSAENVRQENEGSATNSMGQSGYEGDVDSEVEVNECEKL